MPESKSDVLQGTLDLMVLKTLEAMGPLHGYGIARRIEQVSENTVSLNQGTIYPALLRLEQCAKDLHSLQKDHRVATLGAIASASMTASEAMASVDAVRRMDAIAHHTWRSAAHLVEDHPE